MATLDSILRTDHKAVDKRDELHSVMGWIQGDTARVPLVVDDGTPYGIVNERALVSRKIESKAHVEGFTLATRALPVNASLEEAALRMAEFRAPYLPVADLRGQLVGYVTALDVARELDGGGRASDMCVPVEPLRKGSTMGDAVHLFAKEYVPVLPVMDGNGRVAGILPRRTTLRVGTDSSDRGRKDAGGEKFHMLHDPVEGFMDDAPVSLPAAAGFHEVLDAVEENGYVLVQQGGKVVGLVTPETLMRNATVARRP